MDITTVLMFVLGWAGGLGISLAALHYCRERLARRGSKEVTKLREALEELRSRG